MVRGQSINVSVGLRVFLEKDKKMRRKEFEVKIVCVAL